MTDIFDEVDDILSELDSVEEVSTSPDAAEKNFNDSELQDIMAEIENLEKDFANEDSVTAVKKPTLQEQIDQEVEMSMKENSSPVLKEADVIPFEKVTSPVQTKNSEISFEAQGQMNLNLEFKIGTETALLKIDPVKGLTVTLGGVELCINQEEGCKFTMENGVKFTIPLTSNDSALKKKAI